MVESGLGSSSRVSVEGEASALAGAGAWPRRALRYALAHGMEAATIFVMAVEVVVVVAGVFSRYVVNRPIAGSDEIATLAAEGVI